MSETCIFKERTWLKIVSPKILVPEDKLVSMARQLFLFLVLLTCICVSWGETCNWTSNASSRINDNYEKTMLDGWINIANGFVHLVAPKDLTTLDKVEEYRQRKQDISFKDLIFDLFRIEAAFAACFFLGLIYVLSMGSGWTCFLCCRCCGNCGGNKTQRQTKNINNRRCIYVVLTIVVLGFLTAAVASAFMANEEIYKVTRTGHSSIVNVIDKVELYVNNTQKEIMSLNNCYEETGANLMVYVGDEKITEDIAEPLKEKIQTKSESITETLETLNNEFQGVKGLKQKVASVKSKEERVGELKNKIELLRGTCTSSLDAECTNTINKLDSSDFEEVKSSSFSTIPSKVVQVFDLDFEQEFQDQLNQIPKKIVKETKKSRDGIVQEFQSLTQNKILMEGIEKGVNEFHNETNRIEGDLSVYYKKYITDNEANMYWGVFGLIMLVAVPSGLLLLGLCAGLLGSKSGRYPSERSGLSECGGCTMMASVYLMFIFGSLAMLCTAVFFQVGGHVEGYGCRYLYEANLTTVDRVLNIFLPNNSDVKTLEDLKTLKIGEIASQCERDTAIYQAVPNIESILRVKYLTFEKEIDKVNVHKYEKEISQMITRAIDRFKNDLEKAVKAIDINALHELLRLAKGKIIKADITKTIEDLERLDTSQENERTKLVKEALGILRDLKAAAEKRKEITTVLGTDGAEIANYKTKVDDAAKKVHTQVDTITPSIVATAKEMVKDYCQDILSMLKRFAKDTTKIITEEVGRCGTLYDAFSLGRHLACREVLGPLNALWFSLGMCCFLFLFAIPFATKLSKHFYVMDDDKDTYVGMDSLHGHHINGYSEHKEPVAQYKYRSGYGEHQGSEAPDRGGNNNARGPPRPMHHQNGAYEPDVDERWTRY